MSPSPAEPGAVHYQVHECFWSLNGEGAHTGHTSVFLRLQGCPVGCEWCDSKLTWYRGGERMTLEAIVGMIEALPASEWVVITGGEPLIYDLGPLLGALDRRWPARKTHVETSGVFPYKSPRRPAWTCVSPKYTRAFAVEPSVMAVASELKYVVDEHFEPALVTEHLRQYDALWCESYGISQARSGHLLCTTLPLVYLMPEGCPPRDEMVERTVALLAEHPRWRFSPRIQYDYAAITRREGGNNTQRDRAQVREAVRRGA